MAVQLAREGCQLAITGRRQDKLNEAAQAIRAAAAECLPLAGDVVDPAQVKAHYARIKELWGGLDWAILNAGVSDSKNARNFSAENCRQTFAVNLGGVVNWMDAVLPDMLKAQSGVIAGIASLAGFRGLPWAGPYCASKAGLIALLESTRIDLRGSGVDIVTVCPGFVKSEITGRHDPRYMPFLLETEDGSRRIIDGIKKRKRLVHFPWQLSWPMIYLVRYLPGWLYEWILSRFSPRMP